MNKNYAYVDSQSVTLLNGQLADIEVNYDYDIDQFIVEADAEHWISDMEDFMDENYPDSVLTEVYDEARADCASISGRYNTLREINERLEQYCEQGSWYDFKWQYDDGTPVE